MSGHKKNSKMSTSLRSSLSMSPKVTLTKLSTPRGSEEVSADVYHLYVKLKEELGKQIPVAKVAQHLQEQGININKDLRLKDIASAFSSLDPNSKMELDHFNKILKLNKDLVSRTFTKKLAIPNFQEFLKLITILYDSALCNCSGQAYLLSPQMMPYEKEWWGVSLCSIDGQRASFGHANIPAVIQSITKVFLYALAIQMLGQDMVHKYVNVEYVKLSPPEVVLNGEGIFLKKW